jgi:hypothetical protein
LTLRTKFYPTWQARNLEIADENKKNVTNPPLPICLQGQPLLVNVHGARATIIWLSSFAESCGAASCDDDC